MNRIVEIPWGSTLGTKVESMFPGEVVVFKMTPPDGFSSNGKHCSFVVSPAAEDADRDGRDNYHDREMCLSDQPGTFEKAYSATMVRGQSARIYFSVGGSGRDRWGRPNTRYADRQPGAPMYFSVRTVEPGLTQQIDYALIVHR